MDDSRCSFNLLSIFVSRLVASLSPASLLWPSWRRGARSLKSWTRAMSMVVRFLRFVVVVTYSDQSAQMTLRVRVGGQVQVMIRICPRPRTSLSGHPMSAHTADPDPYLGAPVVILRLSADQVTQTSFCPFHLSTPHSAHITHNPHQMITDAVPRLCPLPTLCFRPLTQTS